MQKGTAKSVTAKRMSPKRVIASSDKRGLPSRIEEEVRRRGYIAREMVQCTLPHSDPGEAEVFSRRDGNLILSIRSGYDHVAQKPIGLPYGPIAKLLIIWITSEAIAKDNPRIELVKTLGTFLRLIGLDRNTGRGKRSDAKRVKEQMHRLLNAIITFVYAEDTPKRTGSLTVDMNVAPIRSLWWDTKDIDGQMLFDSYVVLGREFFEAIKENAVPVDLVMAGHLKRSPLALDLFIWLTYRLYRMNPQDTITVSYLDLKSQFGANYSTEKNFRAAIRDAMKKVAGEWTALQYELTERGLTLHGLPKSALPIQEKPGALTFSRPNSNDPFTLSAPEMMKARDFAGNWDIFAMRLEWEKWCKAKKIVPDVPVAHFIDFLKKHRNLNG